MCLRCFGAFLAPATLTHSAGVGQQVRASRPAPSRPGLAQASASRPGLAKKKIKSMLVGFGWGGKGIPFYFLYCCVFWVVYPQKK